MRLLLTLILIFYFSLPSPASAGKEDQTQALATIENGEVDSEKCRVISSVSVSSFESLSQIGFKLYLADAEGTLWQINQEVFDIMGGGGCPPPVPYDE